MSDLTPFTIGLMCFFIVAVFLCCCIKGYVHFYEKWRGIRGIRGIQPSRINPYLTRDAFQLYQSAGKHKYKVLQESTSGVVTERDSRSQPQNNEELSLRAPSRSVEFEEKLPSMGACWSGDSPQPELKQTGRRPYPLTPDHPMPLGSTSSAGFATSSLLQPSYNNAVGSPPYPVAPHSAPEPYYDFGVRQVLNAAVGPTYIPYIDEDVPEPYFRPVKLLA